MDTNTDKQMSDDQQILAKKNLRLACVLGLISLAVYVGFFLLYAT